MPIIHLLRGPSLHSLGAITQLNHFKVIFEANMIYDRPFTFEMNNLFLLSCDFSVVCWKKKAILLSYNPSL